jgi:hypothetical protein
VIEQNTITGLHLITHKIAGLIIAYAKPGNALLRQRIVNTDSSGSDFISQ